MRTYKDKEELKDVLAIAQLRRKVFGTLSSAILVMASLTITNTMLMAMLERKKEIGVLMANGMNDKKILKMFLTFSIFFLLYKNFYQKLYPNCLRTMLQR